MQEISLYVLDVVQNCLAAGASRVEIEVVEDRASDVFRLTIRDNGRGMDAGARQRATDPFYTTRTTRKVGLGLPLLKAAAEQCGGGMRLSSAPGRGTTVEATFQHSSWDRAPLGDMASTLTVTLAGNPELELCYRHKVDGRVFEFRTEDAKEKLQGVPINLPSVLEWLKEYLQQAIKNLYGGDRN
jgi:hypothetical protein